MASFTCTLYNLILGAQDATTGWYRKTWSQLAITMPIIPKSSSRLLSAAGTYARGDAVGFTQYVVKTGDVVLDAPGQHYLIEGVRPYYWGNEFVYNEVDLGELLTFTAGFEFFGFEVRIEDVQEFEDGFERGMM